MKMRTSGKYLSLLILLLAAQLGAQDPNLIAYYPFSGDAGDSSGNGNHGTVDGATLTSDRFGNPNQAFLFDGVNDYISATLDATEEFSVACWTKSNTTDYPGTANGTAIHMENGNQAVFLLQVDATNDKMRGRTYHGDYTIYDEAQIDLEWHFWVIKKDESHFFLYKDNSVVDSIAISLSQTANDLDFFVGQHEGGFVIGPVSLMTSESMIGHLPRVKSTPFTISAAGIVARHQMRTHFLMIFPMASAAAIRPGAILSISHPLFLKWCKTHWMPPIRYCEASVLPLPLTAKSMPPGIRLRPAI
jgi:hypothetical protein